MSYVPPSDLVLSIYPNARGFGFVLFEGPLSPYDWGVKDIRGNAKNRRIIHFIERLIDAYAPVIIVIEDLGDGLRERIARMHDLYDSLIALAKRKLVHVVRYPMTKVREYFAYRNALTKYQIAQHIAKIVPAFAYNLPPIRKIWNTEDARQTLYDAAAFGLVFYGHMFGNPLTGNYYSI